MSYSMTLDTPLHFWAEEHRPAAFLTVCFDSYTAHFHSAHSFFFSLVRESGNW
jgi:hypothetical protein